MKTLIFITLLLTACSKPLPRITVDGTITKVFQYGDKTVTVIRQKDGETVKVFGAWGDVGHTVKFEGEQMKE